MSTFTNVRPDRMARSHRPYRPTTLHSARATAAYQRWLPILIMAAIVALLSMGVR